MAIQKIAELLGKKIWQTNLFIPDYHVGEIGQWKIVPGGQLLHDWGYYSDQCLVAMNPALARRSDSKSDDHSNWAIWMSLTPHEIESQELGCHYAYGHTVVMGLGMGWVAANIALNPKVTRVTIIEIDSEVIDLFTKSGAFDSLPETAQNKISIIHANAVEWKPDSHYPVNFLFADIWLHLAEKETLNQVRIMQQHIHAKTIYYWGQEIAIYNAIKNTITISPEQIKTAVEEKIKLPLLIPDDRNYGDMIEKVIQNRMMRRLPIKLDVSHVN